MPVGKKLIVQNTANNTSVNMHIFTALHDFLIASGIKAREKPSHWLALTQFLP